MGLNFLLSIEILLFSLLIGLLTFLIWYRITHKLNSQKKSIAFFHPYCNDGGGGERVLWCFVKSILEVNSNIDIIIFTGQEKISGEQILQKAKTIFDIDIPKEKVRFIFLKKRWLIEDKIYPYFTLLGQSLGSIILGWEALSLYRPHIMIDTMGYAFIYPLFKWIGGCRVFCYVHYPTISTDMLSLVASGSYYHIFAKLYSFVGSQSELIMVNSSWTLGHINSLWKKNTSTFLVYPPCNTKHSLTLPLNPREPVIISIGQFRPEKNHALQIRSFHKFYLSSNNNIKDKIKLIVIGSCRNSEDQKRVDNLKELVENLQLQDKVIFQINIPFAELHSWLSKAMIGVHTMENEHFGIGVVQFMASGVISVAHNSAGPKEDIIGSFPEKGKKGYLASTEEEYAKVFEEIFSMNQDERLQIQQNARTYADEVFSDEIFSKKVKELIANYLK